MIRNLLIVTGILAVVCEAAFFWYHDAEEIEAAAETERLPSPADGSEQIADSEDPVDSVSPSSSDNNRAVSNTGRAPPSADAKPEPGPEAFRPVDLYLKYVDEANRGDVDAQYVLATVLSACLRTAKTEDEIAELERTGMEVEFLEAATERFRKCKPLHDALPNLENQYERWYRAARDAQHPLILVKRRNISIDEKRWLLLSAIAADYPEPHLYAEAFLEAARFHRTHPERLDISRDEAWLLLYCTASFQCDSEKERENLRTKYQDHQYEEIVELEASLRDAIGRRDWDALGF